MGMQVIFNKLVESIKVFFSIIYVVYVIKIWTEKPANTN